MTMFDLIVDEKVSVWRRSYISVEAATLEDAVKDCIERGSEAATNTLESEYIFETEEHLSSSEDNWPIIEVMDRKFKTLGTK